MAIPIGFQSLFIISEAILLIIYGFVTQFGDGIYNTGQNEADFTNQQKTASTQMYNRYAMYQDVHVMIFIGFGFLMVFLKTHSWTSVGFNYLIACWCIQLNLLVMPFWEQWITHPHFYKINFGIPDLIEADFAAAAVLISFGALLGKCNWGQLFVLATLEVILYAFNCCICYNVLSLADAGGSFVIHMFGAFFGLSASFFFEPKKAIANEQGRCGGNMTSQVLAMIGTIFLFMYWPSFNAALVTGVAQQRAVVNTLVSISASVLTSSFVSLLFKGQFDMEVLLNSSLAGGVAIGASCDLIIAPVYAFLVGLISGAISAIGFLKANANVQSTIKLHDTCGVQYLHGWPAIIGAIASSCAAGMAADLMANPFAVSAAFPLIKPQGCTAKDNIYSCRTVTDQAGIQFACIFITMGIAILGGLGSGFIASRIPFTETFFDDSAHFAHVNFNDEVAKFSSPEYVEASPEDQASARKEQKEGGRFEETKQIEMKNIKA